MDFINEFQIDPEICDQLIALYHACDEQGLVREGALGTKEGTVVDKGKKDSRDLGIVVIPDALQEQYNMLAYYSALQECLNKYINKYPALITCSSFTISESPIIQYYPPGGGYKLEHFERTGWETSTRMLVWMTYLNDVTDGGGTRFTYQEKEVQARKGKTVIWPSDFTHTHAGIVSPSQEKYIITGWFNFTDQ